MKRSNEATNKLPTQPYLLVLGIAQDAGYPQAACKKSCCAQAWENRSLRRSASCLALVFPTQQSYFLFEATPDIKDQMRRVEKQTGCSLAGVFLTHAHIGHYTGLMHFGHEVMGANRLPVYAMPKMREFLTNHGPWSQLVSHLNIELMPLVHDSSILLHSNISVKPFLVPHRDEYSETVGFEFLSDSSTGWFIPDIDKWHKWNKDLAQMDDVDFLLIDGTFYANGEIPNRDMSQIPHPFIKETMQILKDWSLEDKNKVHFIHFNHTNPAIWDDDVRSDIKKTGFNLAYEGQVLSL